MGLEDRLGRLSKVSATLLEQTPKRTRLFWVRWFLLLVGTGFALWAHTMIETPGMQYAMLAQNHSLDPQHPADHNLLGLQSSFLGVVAVTVAMTLNLLLVLTTLSMLRDGLGRRAKPVLLQKSYRLCENSEP